MFVTYICHHCIIDIIQTRIHSSGMRTARSSKPSGGSPPGTPPGAGTPWSRYPLDQTPPEQAPPQDQTPLGAGTPLGPDPPQEQASPRDQTPPSTNRITDTCKNITFSQLRLRAVTNHISALYNYPLTDK